MKKNNSNHQFSSKSFKPNPALENLGILIGKWNTELSNASFLANASDKINGQVSFEWLEGGAFLILRLPIDPPDSIWVIGHDDSVETYSILYFDSRGVSRTYEMSLQGGAWKMWRNSPGFSQRFQGQLSDDGNIIDAVWEKSLDGIKWEHDFDVKYTRIR
jgi:hypothetical protein